MSGGLATTFALLTSTGNDAAAPILVTALGSPIPAIREGALIAILNRRNAAGCRELLVRLPRMTPEWKEIIRQHHSRMTGTLRDAILGADSQLWEVGCHTALWLHEYDLIPALLNALEGSNQVKANLAAKTVIELTEVLYDELAGSCDPDERRDPQQIRRHLITGLENSVQRYGFHKQPAVVEAFLLMVDRDNAVMRLILQNPHNPAFLPMVDALSKSSQRAIIHLLLEFLDDSHAPSAILSVIANRDDPKLIHGLLHKIGREPTPDMAHNLKRIDSIAWLRGGAGYLDQLDDACQHALVRLVMSTSISRHAAFQTIERVLTEGKPAGRREAARALAEFRGAQANALASRALNDPDPQVQANIAAQLRGRGIPEALPWLLELLNSDYEVVRKAASENLHEFNFKRYLTAFEMLDEDERRVTGLLVKKIDSHTTDQLRDELQSPIRSRRLRGLAVARSIDLVDVLENEILDMLQDKDQLIRIEAGATLAHATPIPDTQSPEEREAYHQRLQEQFKQALHLLRDIPR